MQRQRIYDATIPVTETMPIFPGDPTPRLRRVRSIDAGQPFNGSVLEVGCHVGTHLDVPLHFLEGGADVDSFQPDRLMGPAQVIDLTEASEISGERLRRVTIEPAVHVLLKTRNSQLLGESDFCEDYVSLTPDAADVLLVAQPRSVGFDYYSLDPADSVDCPVHRRLAREDVPVCVCLDLREVPAGRYWYACLPLRLPGADGSPVRAVLMEEGSGPRSPSNRGNRTGR